MQIVTKKDIYEAVKQVMTQDFGITKETVEDMMKSTVQKMIDKAAGKAVNDAILTVSYREFQRNKQIILRDVSNKVAQELTKRFVITNTPQQ